MKACLSARRVLAVSLLSAALVESDATAGESDWPNWRGPTHNGISQENGWLSTWPANGPKQLWKASVGTGYSSISVAGNRAYTMGNASDTDTVFCLDTDTGQVLWKHAYAAALEDHLYPGGPNSTPAVDGRVVFSVGRRGQLFCLDAASGKVIWSTSLMKEFALDEPPKDWWGISGSPLVEGDLLILNAGTFGVAVDKKTGKATWSTGKAPCAYASPVPFDHDGKRAVAIFGGKAVAAIEARTGKELWQIPWKTSWDINASDPIVSDGRMFVSSGYGTGGALLELGGATPTIAWRNKDLHTQMNAGVLIGDHVYAVTGQERRKAEIRCFDFKTGTTRWSSPFASMGSLMAADGKLIALSEKGELLVAEAVPGSFKPLARAQVLGGQCWTVPVLSHGRIYCRNSRGDLVCLDVRTQATADARR